MSETRDIESAYRDARIQAYRRFRKIGQTDRAEHMARVLSDVHGYDVSELDHPAGGAEQEPPEPADAAQEHAAEEPRPEAAVEPKPARTPRKPRPTAK